MGTTNNILRAGCIPIREKSGRYEVCLVNSRSNNGHLIFPRGRVEDGESVKRAAIRETFEEAGLRGKLFETPIFVDIEGHLVNRTCADACYFPMAVKKEQKSWPEDKLRDRVWLPIKKVLNAKETADLHEALVRLRKFGLKKVVG